MIASKLVYEEHLIGACQKLTIGINFLFCVHSLNMCWYEINKYIMNLLCS